jgi:hypothetical protein
MAVTYDQVLHGHAQAVSALGRLIAHVPDRSARSASRQTLTDLGTYYGFTQEMHAAIWPALRAGPSVWSR